MDYKSGTGAQNLITGGFILGLVVITSSEMIKQWIIRIALLVTTFELIMWNIELEPTLLMLLMRFFEFLWICYFYLSERVNKISFYEKYTQR